MQGPDIEEPPGGVGVASHYGIQRVRENPRLRQQGGDVDNEAGEQTIEGGASSVWRRRRS